MAMWFDLYHSDSDCRLQRQRAEGACADESNLTRLMKGLNVSNVNVGDMMKQFTRRFNFMIGPADHPYQSNVRSVKYERMRLELHHPDECVASISVRQLERCLSYHASRPSPSLLHRDHDNSSPSPSVNVGNSHIDQLLRSSSRRQRYQQQKFYFSRLRSIRSTKQRQSPWQHIPPSITTKKHHLNHQRTKNPPTTPSSQINPLSIHRLCPRRIRPYKSHGVRPWSSSHRLFQY